MYGCNFFEPHVEQYNNGMCDTARIQTQICHPHLDTPNVLCRNTNQMLLQTTYSIHQARGEMFPKLLATGRIGDHLEKKWIYIIYHWQVSKLMRG